MHLFSIKNNGDLTMGNYIETRHIKNYQIPRAWVQYIDTTVFKRASVLALIIGFMLTLGNQTEAVFGVGSFVKLQLILAFTTPFIVITLSQLGAIHQANIDLIEGGLILKSETFITSISTHNIPARALIISMIVGGVSSLIILTNTVLLTGGLENTPWPQLAQSYVLPFIFGALSQALTYRRSITK